MNLHNNGSISLVGTASLDLTGGVTASDVLYNLTGANSNIITHVGVTLNGIILDVPSTQNFTLDGTFNGEIIANDLTLMSGAIVNGTGSSTAVTPEPSSLLLLGTGLLSLGGTVKRRFAV
jgi:hypothetical protein